jgi:hypothetical protein
MKVPEDFGWFNSLLWHQVIRAIDMWMVSRHILLNSFDNSGAELGVYFQGKKPPDFQE